MLKAPPGIGFKRARISTVPRVTSQRPPAGGGALIRPPGSQSGSLAAGANSAGSSRARSAQAMPLRSLAPGRLNSSTKRRFQAIRRRSPSTTLSPCFRESNVACSSCELASSAPSRRLLSVTSVMISSTPLSSVGRSTICRKRSSPRCCTCSDGVARCCARRFWIQLSSSASSTSTSGKPTRLRRNRSSKRMPGLTSSAMKPWSSRYRLLQRIRRSSASNSAKAADMLSIASPSRDSDICRRRSNSISVVISVAVPRKPRKPPSPPRTGLPLRRARCWRPSVAANSTVRSWNARRCLK